MKTYFFRSRVFKSSFASLMMVVSCILPTYAKAQASQNILREASSVITKAKEKGYLINRIKNPNGSTQNQIESPVITGVKGYNDFRLRADSVVQMPSEKSQPVRIFIKASSNKPELGNLGFTTIELTGENPELARAQIQAAQVDLARQIENNLSKKGLIISDASSKKSAFARIIENLLFQKAHANNPIAQFMAGIVFFIIAFMTVIVVVEKVKENPKEFFIQLGLGSLLVAGAVGTGLFFANLE